ncbi:MAG TPA: glycosyltransferase family 9 protein, partial [Thermomicrobiales bacterium]|nr:glycosyltransferase family 9 protein [Thermomicrobiales bacterium]
MSAAVAAEPRRIAVFRALALGDLLCATPALRALRQQFPDAEIVLIGLPWSEALAARLDSIDRVSPFPGWPGIRETPVDAARLADLMAEAHAEPFDLAIQMHGSGEISNGFVAALGARRSLGFRVGDDGRLSDSLPWHESEHETLRWLRLVGLLGATAPGSAPEFPLRAADHAEAAALLGALPPGDGPVVALHPGAADPARRWPPDRFARLGDELAARFGARLILTGSAGERPLTAALRGAMRAPTLDLAGRTSLGDFAATLARVDLLVTNDTGASHLAAATRTPSVVLFGPTRPDRWAPLHRRLHRVVDAQSLRPGDPPALALQSLPVELVFAACAEMLAAQQDAGSVLYDPNLFDIGQETPWTA